ncbi:MULTISPECIES: flagellar motor switch protein FliG [unclassified Mesorhizobium]|jgi:flagellar motor switch protein FliG|uniref:flagellar motor switch protein FliG n=1 Tax=unclassified Mesorhizobium TaxID=325217 RepID=UPI0008E6621D|nr:MULTISPECIES: flagellar motor switch protein FliG [unclassified Mesorhizobium]RJG44106.1 flagellar motor switch protein FliG [Mesorhizobium sp. DCY119]SFU05841.1 flagellar motor switch protein FliG [Mesorhizobium sp. YR577]
MTTALVNLTRAQKAAAILVAMGKPSASRLLKFFKQEELKALIEAARLLRTIPQGDLERIVAEFEAEFTEGAGLLDSGDQMDTIMNESLSAEEMDAIMGNGKKVAGPQGPPPVWPDLEKVEPERLGKFLASEHPQTSAVILSKLAPSVAANVLLALEKPQRGDIIRRMMSMTTVPEAATRIVENQLRTRVLSEGAKKDISVGQTRVASLLNEMDKSQLDEVMQGLEETGVSDLDGIRARLFSFDDIPLLAQKSRVVLFDGLSTELVTLCLRGASPEITEAVLSSIGARARRMIEAELGQEVDGISAAEVTKARRSVASTAIRMSLEGAFELPSTQHAA